MRAEFVEEMWDIAIFTKHGIIQLRTLIDQPRFTPAHAEAMPFLDAEDEEEED
jgi:hypothetical protein